MAVFETIFNRKLAVYGVSAVLGLATALGIYLVSAQNKTGVSGSNSELQKDLIEARAQLEGWYNLAGKGVLGSADYRSQFMTDLKAMGENIKSDSR